MVTPLSHSHCSQSFDGAGFARVLLPVSTAEGTVLRRTFSAGSSACGNHPLCNQGLPHVYVCRCISLSLFTPEINTALIGTKSLCTHGAKALELSESFFFYFGLIQRIFIFYGRNTVSLLKRHRKMRRRGKV